MLVMYKNISQVSVCFFLSPHLCQHLDASQTFGEGQNYSIPFAFSFLFDFLLVEIKLKNLFSTLLSVFCMLRFLQIARCRKAAAHVHAPNSNNHIHFQAQSLPHVSIHTCVSTHFYIRK